MSVPVAIMSTVTAMRIASPKIALCSSSLPHE